MKPVRYGTRFGCKFGQPHDFARLGETKDAIVEKCKLCGIKKRWRKGYKGRINNPEYLKAHVRQFAQEFGSTKRVFAKLYKQEKCVIHI